MASMKVTVRSAKDKADKLKAFVEDIKWEHDDILKELTPDAPTYKRHSNIDDSLSDIIELLDDAMTKLELLIDEVN